MKNDIIVRAEQSRTLCFDFLMVFAVFAVMLLHVAANKWHSTDVHSFVIQSVVLRSVNRSYRVRHLVHNIRHTESYSCIEKIYRVKYQ